MDIAETVNSGGVNRISISLPEGMLHQLDEMVMEKGFESRSQAIADMIHYQLTEHRQDVGETIMAGTINLVYDHSIPGVQKQLSDLQHEYIDEVISALNVNLELKQTMSVILVQGPASKLKLIVNRMNACRGVISGKLLMSAAILPQLHPLPGGGEMAAQQQLKKVEHKNA